MDYMEEQEIHLPPTHPGETEEDDDEEDEEDSEVDGEDWEEDGEEEYEEDWEDDGEEREEVGEEEEYEEQDANIVDGAGMELDGCSGTTYDNHENEFTRGEIDGLFCPICFDAWSSGGDHHVCCLPCGHIYGLSCIKKWLQRPGSDKCPQCKKKCGIRDIRLLYASRVVAVDGELQKTVRSLEAKCVSFEKKSVYWSKKEVEWKKREADLSNQVQYLKELFTGATPEEHQGHEHEEKASAGGGLDFVAMLAYLKNQYPQQQQHAQQGQAPSAEGFDFTAMREYIDSKLQIEREYYDNRLDSKLQIEREYYDNRLQENREWCEQRFLELRQVQQELVQRVDECERRQSRELQQSTR